MGHVIEFPTFKAKGKGESAFITVLHEDDMVIKWNGSSLFYIAHSKYPVKSYVFQIRRVESIQEAQVQARHFYKGHKSGRSGKRGDDQWITLT